MPAVHLTDLQQQIAQREQELQTLRQELEARQSELATLTTRKTDLLAQLRHVEDEIAALATTPASSSASESPPPSAATALSSPSPSALQGQPKLSELIVTLLREAGRALTSRELREDALRRGYQSRSKNLVKTIEVRIQDLKHKGIVLRALGQPGYVLAHADNGVKAEAAKRSERSRAEKSKRETVAPQVIDPSNVKKSKRGAVAPMDSVEPGLDAPKRRPTSGKPANAAKKKAPNQLGTQPSLGEVLTVILRKNRRPLSGSELAVRALSSGYRTQSKNFVKVVWTTLSEMKNVEQVAGQGYRLKKSQSKS